MTTTRQPIKRRRLWFFEFYRSAVGKKWVMAVTGLILIGYLLAHMVGNLKMYIGAESINVYGESLRELGGHLVPRTHLLWLMRFGLLAATILHFHSAATLTLLNRSLRPDKYDERHYAAANYASRTMIWGGLIIAAFVVFHLADLTWGWGGAEFTRGCPTRTWWPPSRGCRWRSSTSSPTCCWGCTSTTGPGACSRASGSTTPASTSGGGGSHTGCRGPS